MSWIVHVDLNTESIAPAIYARWAAHSASIALVHVVDGMLASVASVQEQEQIQAGARAALAKVAERAGLEPDRVDLHVGLGGRAEDVLSELAEKRGAQGIITARQSAFGDDEIVHLGGTTRRLLRRLPVPVVVVPPELVAEGIGEGPVLLAGDGHHDARKAKTFATNVGTAVGRETEMVHVFPKPFKPGASGLPAAAWAGMYERYRAQQHAKLERWMSAFSMGEMKVHEVDGDPIATLTAIGRQLKTPLLVTASRELDTASRIFNSSVGSQLASLAPFPVAVAPKA